MSEPALSIVITARHDNYGGDFRERIAAPLRFNYERLAERRVAFEVILVEWDPVPGRPLLSDVLLDELPAGAGRVLRRIVVDARYQRAMAQNENAGYLEYIAKNVGIRRAAAPFVLVTNADILLGREVVNAIAARQLEPRTMYRSPRYDIKLGIDQTGLTWEALDDPANQVRQPVLRPPLFSSAAGDFLLADRTTFHELRGFNEVYRAARAGIDSNFMVKVHSAGIPIAELPGPVYHLNHLGSMRITKALYREKRSDSPWGDLDWHSAQVSYNNPKGWGLGGAPSRLRSDGTTFLEFDWGTVPPLIELRRVVLPVRATELDEAAAEDSDAGGTLADASEAVDPLTRLAIRHGTDKWGPHFYTPIYHSLFGRFRERPVRLLEIGVGGQNSAVIGGASLRMWADYFPKGRIVGIDIAEKRLETGDRVTILQGSQTDPDFLAGVVAAHGPFDIIIDDGSHRPQDVRASFDILFPGLADNGLYVIEDIQTAFWPDFGGSSADGADTMSLATSVLLGINHEEIRVVAPERPVAATAATIRALRAWHNLLVFEKGDNGEPSSARYDIDNAHAQRAIAIAQHELADSPTPAGLAQLAHTYMLGRRYREALEIIERGLGLCPDDTHLLMLGLKAAKRCGDRVRPKEYVDRLAPLAGSDPAVRELLGKINAGGAEQRAITDRREESRRSTR